MSIPRSLKIKHYLNKSQKFPSRKQLIEHAWFKNASVSYIQDYVSLKKCSVLELYLNRWEIDHRWKIVNYNHVYLNFDFKLAYEANYNRLIEASMEGPNYPIDQRAFLRACHFLASSLEGIIAEGKNIRMSPEEFATKYEDIINSPLDLSPPNWLPKRSE